MLTIGDKVEGFKVTGVFADPLDDGTYFQEITDKSFEGQWKIYMFYPKDFTFVCPTEIVEYDKLNTEFMLRNTILMMGSTDNEFCKLAWKEAHPDLGKITSIMFADTFQGGWIGSGEDEQYVNGLVDTIKVRSKEGVALRATIIVDPTNTIQHISVNNLDTGRNPKETLRILDALQTGELTACNREVGGETL
jgi:peroxiredoxin (alkyl hydroperoxide reductase subunit C)